MKLNEMAKKEDVNIRDGRITVDPFYNKSDFTSLKLTEPQYTGFWFKPTTINRFLKSLKGCPRDLSGSFETNKCSELKTLEYSPQSCRNYTVSESGIKDLRGITPVIRNFLYIEDNEHLESFAGIKSCQAVEIIRCYNIKTIKHLWNCNYRNAEIGTAVILHEKNFAELDEALDIMNHYIANGKRNYLDVIKTAREKDLEDFFR